MCTLALYFQESKDAPLIVAANRDEYLSRPSAPPQLLREKPRIFGGKDLAAGGTWLGINEHGLLAGIVNRRAQEKSKNPAARSRGLLCLDLLEASDTAEARALLKKESGLLYQPFNILFADAEEAFAGYNANGGIKTARLDRGLHVLGNAALFDPRSEKLDHAHKLFLRARQPLVSQISLYSVKGGVPAEPLPSFIQILQEILGDHTPPAGSEDPKAAICVHAGDYGTVSSSIIVLARKQKRFYFYHTPTAPCRGAYEAAPFLDIL